MAGRHRPSGRSAAPRGRPRARAPAAPRGRGRRRRRAPAGRGPRPAPRRRGRGPPRAGRGRGRRRSCRRRGARRVVGFERRGEPALGPEAGALRERGARDQADPAAPLRRPQRRPEPGGAAADDGDVELGCGGDLGQPLGAARRAGPAARSRRIRGLAPARPRPRRSGAPRAPPPRRPVPRPPRPALRSRSTAPRLRRSPAPSLRARAAAPPRARAAAAFSSRSALGPRPLEVGLERRISAVGRLRSRCSAAAAASPPRFARSAASSPARRGAAPGGLPPPCAFIASIYSARGRAAVAVGGEDALGHPRRRERRGAGGTGDAGIGGVEVGAGGRRPGGGVERRAEAAVDPASA